MRSEARRTFFLALVLIAAFVLPWEAAALGAIGLSLLLPLTPLTLGLLLDALYYTHHVAVVPWCTLFGALGTLAAWYVRSRLSAGIIAG